MTITAEQIKFRYTLVMVESFFIFITSFGNYELIFAMLVGGLILSRISQTARQVIWVVTGSSITTLLIVELLKVTLKIPRPAGMLIEVSSYSFPSGHAAIAFGFYFLLWFLLRNRVSVFLQVVLLTLTILLPVSRLVLQVHRPVEVVTGSVIGVLVCLIFIKFYLRCPKNS